MIEFALYAQLGVFLMVAVPFALHRKASLFHPLAFYLMFHFIVFVLRPFMVHYLGFESMWIYMIYRPTETHFIKTLVISSFGLLVFAGVNVAFSQARVRFSSRGLPPMSLAQRRGFVVTLALLLPFAIWSAVFASGGASFDGTGEIRMTQDVATGIPIYVNTTGYLASGHAILASLTILFLWRYRFQWWAYAPILMYLAYRAFLGWGRYAIITTLLSLALLRLYDTRRRWFRPLYIAMVIPVFILFQNLGMDRSLVRDYVESDQVTRAVDYRDRSSYLKTLDGPDFANFDFLAYVTWVVPDRSRTYTFFTQYLQLFTEPIPRILWKEKPIGPPVVLVNLNDYGNFIAMTTSLVGDGWMSWGWAGVVITMALVAFVLGRMHRWFWRNQDNAYVILTYTIFIPLSIQWFRDGSISIAKFALFALFPVVFWIVASKVIGGFDKLMRPHNTPLSPHLR